MTLDQAETLAMIKSLNNTVQAEEITKLNERIVKLETLVAQFTVKK